MQTYLFDLEVKINKKYYHHSRIVRSTKSKKELMKLSGRGKVQVIKFCIHTTYKNNHYKYLNLSHK